MKSKKKIKNQKGFTFVELLTVMACMGILAIIIGGIYVLMRQVSDKVASQSKAIDDAHSIVNMISQEILSVPTATVIVNPEATKTGGISGNKILIYHKLFQFVADTETTNPNDYKLFYDNDFNPDTVPDNSSTTQLDDDKELGETKGSIIEKNGTLDFFEIEKNPPAPYPDEESTVALRLRTSWGKALPQMSTIRFRHSAAILNSQIYVFGGWNENEQIVNSVRRFDISNETWYDTVPGTASLLEDMSDWTYINNSKVGMSCCVYNDEIWLLGGGSGISSVNRVAIFNPISSPQWRLVSTTLPVSVGYAGCTVIDDNNGVERIFIFGGNTVSADTSNIIQAYDPIGNNWRTSNDITLPLTPIPNLTSHIDVGKCYGLIYLWGGGCDKLQIYDPTTNNWNVLTLPDTEMVLWYNNSAVISDTLFILGGEYLDYITYPNSSNKVFMLYTYKIADTSILPNYTWEYKWYEVNNLAFLPRQESATVVDEDNEVIYIMGGANVIHSGGTDYYNNMRAFRPISKTIKINFVIKQIKRGKWEKMEISTKVTTKK